MGRCGLLCHKKCGRTRGRRDGNFPSRLCSGRKSVTTALLLLPSMMISFCWIMSLATSTKIKQNKSRRCTFSNFCAFQPWILWKVKVIPKRKRLHDSVHSQGGRNMGGKWKRFQTEKESKSYSWKQDCKAPFIAALVGTWAEASDVFADSNLHFRPQWGAKIGLSRVEHETAFAAC